MTCAVMFSAAIAGRNRWVTLHPAAKAAASDSVVAMRFIGKPSHLSLLVTPMLCRRPASGQRAESRLLNAGALLYLVAQMNGGSHEWNVWPAGRGAAGAGADVGSCRSAKQGNRRDRGRRLPVLPADRAGQAARRIRKGGASSRTGRPQGRF